MPALPKTVSRRFAGRNHQQTAIAGLLVAVLALGMTVASVTQEWAMPAAERTPADAVAAAFAALGLAPVPAPAPVSAPVKTVTVAALPAAATNDATVARPQVEDKCSDFSFAFFSTQCVKVHKKHTSLRRRAVTTTFKPAAPTKPAASNEHPPTAMRLAEDAKTSRPNAKSSPTVR